MESVQNVTARFAKSVNVATNATSIFAAKKGGRHPDKVQILLCCTYPLAVLQWQANALEPLTCSALVGKTDIMYAQQYDSFIIV